MLCPCCYGNTNVFFLPCIVLALSNQYITGMKLSSHELELWVYMCVASYRIVRIVSYRIVSFYIVLYRFVSFCIVVYRFISFYIVLYRFVS